MDCGILPSGNGSWVEVDHLDYACNSAAPLVCARLGSFQFGRTKWHPARGQDLRHGRDLRRSNRTPDRARAGTVEALCRDGGIISGENILKVNVYVTSVEMFPAVNEVYRR
jgi:hypothetical protein